MVQVLRSLPFLYSLINKLTAVYFTINASNGKVGKMGEGSQYSQVFRIGRDQLEKA